MNTTEIFGLIITIILGLGWGSFATMATYRIPRNMPWIGDKPRCFLCKTPLTIIDYFSIISVFIHKGKCRHCGGEYEDKISYFITELGITLFFILGYLRYNFNDIFVLYTLMTVNMVVLGVVDAEFKKIPSKILIAMLTLGIMYRMFIDLGSFYGVIYGAIIGGLTGIAARIVYFGLYKDYKTAFDFMQWNGWGRFEGKGFDYVKMLSIAGIWLPIAKFELFLNLSILILSIWWLVSKKTLRPGSIMAFLLLVIILT